MMSVIAFHEKAGRSQVDSSLFLWTKVFLPPSGHCRHASIRTLEERSFRSVHVGRSRFSRCCHLFGALSFHLSGTWARRLTQSPELGFGLLSFLFLERGRFCFCRLVLRGCGHVRLAAVVQWFVHFSAHPQVMQ